MLFNPTTNNQQHCGMFLQEKKSSMESKEALMNQSSSHQT
jgi:hypothetical protein